MIKRADMNIDVRIKRTDPVSGETQWQTFEYDALGKPSVAKILEEINLREQLTDKDGKAARRISWECSCLQGVCGACAMVIDGRPALACETFVDPSAQSEVSIEPLRKFHVVADLVVDRSVIDKTLLESEVYIKDYNESSPDEFAHRYQASKCLKCGLCLEVCPNWTGTGKFAGALFANDCYLVDSADSSTEIRDEFGKHFAAGCSKSLSCMKVCPMKIETIASIAKMNRRKKR